MSFKKAKLMKPTFTSVLKTGFLAAIASTVINSILFFILQAAGIFTDTIEIQPGQALTIVPIAISSILPSLIGAIVYFLFAKYSSKGFRNFQILALILLVLSFVNPFMGIPNVTTGYALGLNVMHVVVAFSLLFFIKRSIKSEVN